MGIFLAMLLNISSLHKVMKIVSRLLQQILSFLPIKKPQPKGKGFMVLN